MNVLEIIERDVREGWIDARYARGVEMFYRSYVEYRKSCGLSTDVVHTLFAVYWSLVRKQCDSPYQFEPYHKSIRAPTDYYQFGVDSIRGVMDESRSSVGNIEYADRMQQQLDAGENVILLANHQTEADPQILSILLEKSHPYIAEEIIFVAGERVLTDPLAVPYSLGRNLLCIYSKRHIDHPPEQRAEKLAHNTRAMKVLFQLLAEGKKAIYVAPSGGRDRPDANGVIDVSPFDPSAVEMFRLIASRSPRPCHFYPLALFSHPILPPPQKVDQELGEDRYTRGGPAYIAFGPELDLERCPGCDQPDKHARRQALADYAYEQVVKLYKAFPIHQK